MADGTSGKCGSAAMQAAAWGPGAGDWAEVMEGPNGWGLPVYRRMLELMPVGEATRLLDVGCGAGRFCRVARDRGARVAGLDATKEFIEIASKRTPDGQFKVGDMEELPWQDDSFDVVTGFNSFFLAEDMLGALREARRAARPGGTLALTIFGRPERCDSTTLFAALRQFVEADDARTGQLEPSAPKPSSLHEEAEILRVAREAGLEPTDCAYFQFTEAYPDVETMARGMLAAPPGRRASMATSADEVRQALTEAVQSRVSSSGEVRLREEVRYLLAST